MITTKSLIGFGTLLLVVAVNQANSYEGRIYHGTNAREGQFPYIANIANNLDTGKSTGCTGSIISSRYILAAAHCASNVVSATITLGLTSTYIFNFSMNILQYEVPKSNIYVIKSYDAKYVRNDLSLYKLPVSAPVNTAAYPNIKTIALPKKSDMPVTKFDDMNATAVGFGQVDDGVQSTTLRWTYVHIMEHAACEKEVNSTLAEGFGVADEQICADKKYFNSGICPGDSGGPLVFNRTDGKPMVLGVASYILGNCSSPTPVVYTFLPDYLDWIHKKTGIKTN